MADLTPNNREEHFYKGMVDGSTDLTPNNRKEHWYSEIISAIGSGGGGGGGGGGVGALVIGMTVEGGTMTLDKTWQEIYDHMGTGSLAMVLIEITDADELSVVHQIVLSCEGFPSDSEYYVNFADQSFRQFSAASPSSYPTASM